MRHHSSPYSLLPARNNVGVPSQGAEPPGEIGAPAVSLFCLQPSDASANLDDCAIGYSNDLLCHSIVSGNILTSHNFPTTHTQRLEREEITRHGQTAPEFHPPARQAAVEIGSEGDGSDWFGLGSQRGRVAPARHGTPLDRQRTHHSLSDAAAIIRDQRRRDLLASIAEWERASGPDRVWWRRDARHRLAEWRRLHTQPERAAFQAAVARSRP